MSPKKHKGPGHVLAAVAEQAVEEHRKNDGERMIRNPKVKIKKPKPDNYQHSSSVYLGTRYGKDLLKLWAALATIHGKPNGAAYIRAFSIGDGKKHGLVDANGDLKFDKIAEVLQRQGDSEGFDVDVKISDDGE